jgi:hypothetical protein
MIPPNELSTIELLRMVRHAAPDDYREALELELADRIDSGRRPAESPIDLREQVHSAAPEMPVQATGDLVLQRVS